VHDDFRRPHDDIRMGYDDFVMMFKMLVPSETTQPLVVIKVIMPVSNKILFMQNLM